MWKYDCFAEDFELLCEQKKDDVMIVYQYDAKKSSYTYAEVLNLSKRFLTFFQKNGLQAGDTVVTIMPNSPEVIIAFFAAMLGGLNYAPLPCAVSKREFDNWIRVVQPKMIIKKKGGAVGSNLQMASFECECNGDLSWLSDEEAGFETGTVSHIYLMTSGTTGSPKAISINTNKLWSSAKAFAQFYHIEESSYRFWNYLPMSYLGGLYNLALIPLCCKGSFVISESFSGKTMLNYWNFVTNNGITALWLVPSIVQGLIKISRLVGTQNTSHLAGEVKIAFLGTAPIQLSMKEEFEKVFGLRLYENFALSESTFLTAEEDTNIEFREQGSVGKKMPNIFLKVIPVEGVEKIGVIWIKTPFLFEGYLLEDGTLDIPLDEDGYFNTKDLGYINGNNILVLAGRNRDIIKRGGQFISLNEIEAVVGELPYIENVAAVPVKHDFYGEVYVLCVIFKQQEETEKQKEQLHTWMLDNFAAYKVPDRIYVCHSFPKTASGKIQKNKIAEEIEREIANHVI